MRAGYLVVLLTVAGCLAAAGWQVRELLGMDAYHAGMVNGAGRQRFLAARVVQRALLKSLAPQQFSRLQVEVALAEWADQQDSVENHLRPICSASDPLCSGFALLKIQQRKIAELVRLLAASSGNQAVERGGLLEAALDAYLVAADRWVADFSQRLAEVTVAQQRRVFWWSLLLIGTTAVIVVAVLEPIIRRLQREWTTVDAAAQERQRLAAVAETIHNSVAITDVNGRIEWVNAGYVRITGYRAEQAIGRTDAAVVAGLSKDVEGGRGFHTELIRYRADGHMYWGSIDCRPMTDEAGRAAAYIIIESDVTEERTAADALRAAKEAAEAANRTKGAFLANMSHEIRTPLNGMIGMTGLLLDTKLDSEQREYADIARSSGEALLAIVNDILDLSKIEAGHVDLECIDFDLRCVIDEAVDAVALKAAEKGVELLVDVDLTCPLSFRGDPARLRQILLNLLSNAVKFSEVGDVTVAVAPAPAPDGRLGLDFTVQDCGIGIASDQIHKLFTPFTQADVSTTRRHGGTGLGLSICRRLIEAMGGTIGVSSTPGQGSTFRFQVILEPSAGHGLGTSLSFASPVHALIVDDHPVNLRILAAQLTNWGVTVTTAGGAAEGLQRWTDLAAAGCVPAVAILDHQLPDHDGFWLGREIRRRDSGHNCRLVLLSSLTNRLASVGDDPFDRAIAKPIKRDALLRVLAELLGGAPPQTLSTDDSSKDFAGRHILLVDDNTVNQKLGVRQLNLLGVTVAQAWNGAEAMEKLRLQAFDAVLMDCQMPEMDGYEATRLLRCKDSGVLNPEVPVIAMTANALAGDREQCLAAGMNDYITKPIDRRRLREVLLGAFARVPSTAPAATSESNQEIFDILGLREIVGNDPAFIDELLATFLESAGGLMNQIEQCADQDPALLKRLAHQLRGASANILARRLAATATSVELGDASHKAERLAQLRQDWSESQRQIAELLKKAG